ncbi:sialate O-acetylesterase [Geminisphaera colitermitum]|uniref:sialate O-acetylesterase n=1 Tax=Geminisphaera colitermitum TaxID=1148786 RepID=UPI0002EEAC3F|nr:sialate O-acetylesterase [Geminisphaera colitermitum]
MKTPLICVSALILSCAAHADVVLAPLFRDGAVLQREKPVPVWGTADAGEKVTVTFAGQSVTTTAAADGKWRVDLPALTASAEARTLAVQGKNKLAVNDVIVGEVWLASGQSNMEWRVSNTDAGKFEMAFANNPLIRHYGTKKKVSSTPLATAEGKWERTTPETVGSFTAVGYYFAADLYRALGVPVGIINSSWGGTRIEAWMDAASADKTKGPAFAEIHTRWDKTLADYPAAKTRYEQSVKKWEAARDAAKAAGKPFADRRPSAPAGSSGHPAEPSGLYNGMIAPHVPYALRGFIWYQGCSNTGRHYEYRDFQTAMITGWRQQFAQGDVPFYWAQLANYKGQGPDKLEYAFLRGAQTECLALPKTGQAVIIDIGNVTDIHPRNKSDVGRRLALVALKNDYGKTSLVDSGPIFAAAVREGSAMRVSFKPADIESPLTSPRGMTPPGFELAGADKVFYPAEAKIDGQTVVVTSDKVPEPIAVRYAWRNAPDAGLFNRDGLPACPFRSDDW